MLRELHKASVAWNNSYRRIFSRCCMGRNRSATSVLSGTTLILYLIFWQKMLTSDNIVLAVLPRAVVSKFVAVGSLYGIKTWTLSATKMRSLIWSTFANSAIFLDFICFMSLIRFHCVCVLLLLFYYCCFVHMNK